MEGTIKPGTRCECRTDHPYNFDAPAPSYHARRGQECRADAVRMVTVRDREDFNKRVGELQLCEPCALFHEAKAGAR